MTPANGTDGDFYEDDEPVEKIQAAFERGDKGVTERPRDVNQRAKSTAPSPSSRNASEFSFGS